jgi:hypothetical protein
VAAVHGVSFSTFWLGVQLAQAKYTAKILVVRAFVNYFQLFSIIF